MIRYEQGLRKKVRGAVALAKWQAQEWLGLARGWPVYRRRIDHSVYAVDNEALPSTTFRRAELVHRVSLDAPIDRKAVVEFEHPTALLGHIDTKTDYRRFREELPSRLERLFRWYDPARHRLVGASEKARAGLIELAGRYGFHVPEEGLRTLHWAMHPVRPRLRETKGRLRVFHYGGGAPFAKGTHDVLRAARLAPEISFTVCADVSHELLRQPLPANVEVVPHTSRTRYLKALDAAHVLANPIYSDGWGVILDATARALPIVSHRTWDKDEAVSAGVTGELVDVAPELSLYDGFLLERWHSWEEFNGFLRDATPAALSERLAAELVRYDEDRHRLAAHSEAAGKLHARRHSPEKRIEALLGLYSELLPGRRL